MKLPSGMMEMLAEKIKYIGSEKFCKDQEDLRLKPVDRGLSGKHFVNCIVQV